MAHFYTFLFVPFSLHVGACELGVHGNFADHVQCVSSPRRELIILIKSPFECCIQDTDSKCMSLKQTGLTGSQLCAYYTTVTTVRECD